MEQRPKSKLSTASLVMGILCVVFSLLPFGCCIFSLLGLIFAIICLAKKKGSKAKSVWGLILSIVGVVIRIVGGVVGGIILFAGGTIGILSLGSIMAFLAPVLLEFGMENMFGYDLDSLTVPDSQNAPLVSFTDGNDINLNIPAGNDNSGNISSGNDDSNDWRYTYLPSDESFEYCGFTFTVPKGAYIYGVDEFEEGYEYDWYEIGFGDDSVFFPMTVLDYDEDDDYYDAYDSILEYWYEIEDYGECIIWRDDEIHEWNEDWMVTGLEYYEDGYYSYDLIAFSTHTNKVVLLSCYPYENDYNDTCSDIQYLLKYIEY